MLRALRCRLAPAGPESLEVVAWTGLPGELAERRAAGAYLVVDDALPRLRGLSGIVTDRGRKHRSVPLSRILLRQLRPSLVHASFQRARQLTGSIHTLLENAARRGEQNAYLIAISQRRFDECAARFGATFDTETAEATSEQDLILSDPEEVPVELERRLIGESMRMHAVRQWIVRASKNDEPVLVLGDTGTGKEVVARMIHDLSDARRVHHFLPINCGAIPHDLFESEVFGYVEGAYTHALRHGSQGLWRSAQGGTVFLDEIGDLSLDHQVKLLRVLEQKTVRPLGSSREYHVTARVIAATNRDLYSMMQAREFREDLYYRLASLVITLPRLSDHPDDAARLAAQFWKDIAPRRPALAVEVLEELQRYRWRGNARELRCILVSLHVTFPKAPPSVERLRAVMRLRVPAEGAESSDGPSAAVQQVECLQHLRRARAVIDTCHRIVRRYARRDLDADAERRGRLAAEIGDNLTDLQLLGTRPLRFGTIATYEVTHRLAGGLAVFQSLLARRDADAVRYCRKELASEVAAAAAAVQREEQRILKAL